MDHPIENPTLVDQYGEHLVCVRYRYEKNKQRLTTVEIIVDRQK